MLKNPPILKQCSKDSDCPHGQRSPGKIWNEEYEIFLNGWCVPVGGCLENSHCSQGISGPAMICRGNKKGGFGKCTHWSSCENGKQCKQGSEKCLLYDTEYVFSAYSNRFIMV